MKFIYSEKAKGCDKVDRCDQTYYARELGNMEENEVGEELGGIILLLVVVVVVVMYV